MTSIMDIFKSFAGGNSATPNPSASNGTSTPAPAGTQNANPTVPSSTTIKSDGTGPAAIPAAGEGDKSPLEGFKDLWQKGDTDKKPISLDVIGRIDPAKLMEGASRVDFLKAIKPETLDAALKGDQKAFLDALNQVSQANYAQSAAVTGQMIKDALAATHKLYKEQIIPEVLKTERISNTLRADNPLFENPAVAPLLDAVRNQMAVKFPNATPSDINDKAKEYLSGFAEQIVKSSGKIVADAPKQTQQEKGATDWSKFFDSTNQGSSTQS
jgi:hypothetical protein